ncbi:hypothetical protein HYU20_01710 [Candidatus Woesearchaeota archaeon]|nr:hypothetical protein [Candidatus Woesearchaeota archaeon]
MIRAATADALNEGSSWLMAKTRSGNRPSPINNEKNIFSSESRPLFLNSSSGGIMKRTATAIIVRKPAKPNSAKAATETAARQRSQGE